ncbi:MAG: lamin tail domain-containing protein [candidate division WOR-3 bacterium]|nr:MAG: lamin tail domain-containing protein [candidate division WOR-3 bacterium]
MLFLLLFVVADSPILITEVMSNVRGPETSCGDRNEFVEIYNESTDAIDLAAYRIWDFDDAPPDEICPWTNDSILLKYPAVRMNSTLIQPNTYALILDSEYCSPDTSGGYWQPYVIPDSTLILTTDETTICDGLTTTDPLILYSTVDFCTTSFGTPYDSLDNFPNDPGDGVSWERVDVSQPDEISNWHPSIDTSGCTPGRENSVSGAYDLAIDSQSIYFAPAVATVGENVQIEVFVRNNGLSGTSDYQLVVFDDFNADSSLDDDELITERTGDWVNALDSVALIWTYEHPAQGSHSLGFKIEYPPDVDLSNNLAFKTLRVIGEIGELALSPRIFTPDDDGVNDRLQIDYRLPEAGGRLTVSIFDMRGIRVHDICRNEGWTLEQGTFYWDGRSSQGDMPIGMYIVYLEYRYSDKVTKAKKTAVLAR